MWTLGKRSIEVLESGLHDDLIKIIKVATESSPIDFTLTDGVRTQEEQHKLWQIGRTYSNAGGLPRTNPQAWIKTGGVVTYCDGYHKQSNHQKKADGFGYAIDVSAYIPGRPDLRYDKAHMMVLVGSFLTIGKWLHGQGKIEHQLRSGADWDRDTQFLEPGTFIDMPHLELR